MYKKISIYFIIIFFVFILYSNYNKPNHFSYYKNNNIYLINNFLSNNNFTIIKDLLISSNNYIKNSNNFLRKGSAISHNKMKNTKYYQIFKILSNPITTHKINKYTNLNLKFVPLWDKNHLSIVYYINSGDNIKWHNDGNIYYGERWAGILTIINTNNNGNYSSSKFHYKRNNNEYYLDTPENSLLLFRGDIIKHKVAPLRNNEQRIVISMLFCDICKPKTDLFNSIYQTIVDKTFYG